MSLPTTAVFKLKDKIVLKSFANIGWFYQDESMPRLFFEMMCNKQFPKANTWDTVTVYGNTWQHDQVVKMMQEYADEREK
jgi:hypothetical protein